MIEFESYIRNPAAPTLLVNKIGGIYRTGSLVRVTFVLQQTEWGGTVKTVETASLLWEPHDLYAEHRCLDWALAEMQRGTFQVDDGGRRLMAQ